MHNDLREVQGMAGWKRSIKNMKFGKHFQPNLGSCTWVVFLFDLGKGLGNKPTCNVLQGIIGGVRAAKEGHQVIMTPTSHCYFDYRQSLRSVIFHPHQL